MSSTKILSSMLDELHKRFLAVIKDLSEDDLTYQNEKNSPAIGWVIGHLAGGQHEYLRLIFLGETPSQIQKLLTQEQIAYMLTCLLSKKSTGESELL